MDEEFEGYEESCQSYAQDISRLISEMSSPENTREDQRIAETKARNLLNELDRCVQNMRRGLAGKPPSFRRAMSGKLQQYTADAKGLRRDFERSKQRMQHSDLLTGGQATLSAQSTDQRDRIHDASAAMSRGTRMLEQSRQTLADTEEIGVSVIGNLHHQREQLLAAHSKVKETNSLAGRARKIISDMRCRGRTNKLLLYVMIFVLVIIIGVVVYFGALAPGAPK